jgi:hypothetical protein
VLTTTCGTGSNVQDVICKSTNPSTATCTCWVYAATGEYTNTVGLLYVNAQTGSQNGGCYCPLTGNPSWN